MRLYTGDLSPYSAKVRMQIYAMGISDIKFELPASFFMGKLAEVSGGDPRGDPWGISTHCGRLRSPAWSPQKILPICVDFWSGLW